MGVREQKQETVTEIADKLRESKSTVVVNYRGLNVSQLTDLRKQLREADIDFKVYKNTLARLATRETEMTDLDEFLVGPTAIAFSTEDVIAPAKVLANFAKENEALEIKVGVIEGELLEEAKVKEIASLPSRDGLLSMLLSVLQAPMRNVALAAKAVADAREEQGENEGQEDNE